MKHILKYICILSVIICFFPLLVFAESSTYYTASALECVEFIASNDSTVRHVFRSGNKETRCVILRDPVYHYYNLVFVSLDSSIRFTNSGSSSCPATYNDVQTRTFQGTTYYYQYITRQNIFSGNVVPYVEADYSISNSVFDLAFYYTYGAGAVDPVEPTNWGILRDVSYNTRIAGSGSASMHNVDYVNWNNLLDANGNDINECSVEVQIVPGGWTGSTEQELLAQGLENFNNSSYSPVSVATVNASVGAFSISWQGVCNKLGWNYESLWAKLENEFWRINGWYYQVRLLAPDGYVGSWQTVYTAMSGSAAGSQNILNSNTFNENLYEYITNLSIANNQQIIEYTINENTYIINNPQYEPDHEPDENGNDYTDILRAIRLAVVNLLNGITELPANIISGFTESIEFNIAENLPEDESFENDIGSALENTYYGDLIVALGNLKAVFDAHKDEIGTSESGVLHIPELAFDLEGTHVVFIDETDFSLYSWVSDSPELYAWYNRYLLIVDGIIYIMLIRTLFRRMIAHLNGSK